MRTKAVFPLSQVTGGTVACLKRMLGMTIGIGDSLPRGKQLIIYVT